MMRKPKSLKTSKKIEIKNLIKKINKLRMSKEIKRCQSVQSNL
jgi:hypothetical protein